MVLYWIGHRLDANVQEALLLSQERDWFHTVGANGADRDGAWTAELTDHSGPSAWGANVCSFLGSSRLGARDPLSHPRSRKRAVQSAGRPPPLSPSALSPSPLTIGPPKDLREIARLLPAGLDEDGSVQFVEDHSAWLHADAKRRRSMTVATDRRPR
jgi:hypothetical protein